MAIFIIENMYVLFLMINYDFELTKRLPAPTVLDKRPSTARFLPLQLIKTRSHALNTCDSLPSTPPKNQTGLISRSSKNIYWIR